MSTPIADVHLRFDAVQTRVRAQFGGIDIADSQRTIVLHEGRLAPVVYFPREDVRMDLMTPSADSTFCPFKGNASYWTLALDGREAEQVMWSYEQPYSEVRPIAHYVAFYTELLDNWFEGESEVAKPTLAVEGPYANPLLSWLLTQAPFQDSPAAITAGLADRLNANDMDLVRLNVVVRTLHPQRVGHAYRWDREDKNGVDTFELSYELIHSEEYQNSPFVPIYEGAAGIRRRLDIDEPVLDYPILEELHSIGVSDYVAMPLLFSDGSIHALTMCTDRPGGFSTRQLGQLYEVLAVLARLYEVHANRSTALNVLDAYLGRLSGERVLEGQIRRGDADDIDAIIWFCDLRESTPLAQSMSRHEFLQLLNDFFDAMAGPVLDHGGEVLRFIGDAALAIFPIDSNLVEGGVCTVGTALDRALDAVDAVHSAMATLNEARVAQGQVPLDFGIGLHKGEVTYGNIGTRERLEFTVIGEAANFAARVEGQCRELGHTVLVSEAVARVYPSRFRSLGPVVLKGVEELQTMYTPVFTLPVETN